MNDQRVPRHLKGKARKEWIKEDRARRREEMALIREARAFEKTLKQGKLSTNVERLKRTYEVFYSPAVIFALLFASWWTSYQGVLAMAEWISGDNESTRHIALLVTASAMGAQYALWHFAMRLIPRFATFRAHAIGVIVMLLLMAALALSSTYTSFIGTSRDGARGLELTHQVEDYAG